jgi:hypothetical protein
MLDDVRHERSRAGDRRELRAGRAVADDDRHHADGLYPLGWTKKEIGEELGSHPATISKWLVADGPPAARLVPDEARVMTERWRQRLVQLPEAVLRLLR